MTPRHTPQAPTRGTLVLLLSLALVAPVASLRRALFAAESSAQSLEDVYYLPADPSVLRVMSLGYHEVAADLLWSRVLLYYNEQLSTRTEALYAMRYVGALTTLDPDFARVYSWAGMLPFYLAVEPNQELAIEGARWVVAGSDRFPQDGELAWDAAATILYELMPIFAGPEDERRHWQEEAARLNERAVELGAGPPWLASNNAELLRTLGHQDRAIRYLEQRMYTAGSEDERADLRSRIAALKGGVEAAMIEAEGRRLDEARLREFPYLSVDEYIVIGERAYD